MPRSLPGRVIHVASWLLVAPVFLACGEEDPSSTDGEAGGFGGALGVIHSAAL